MFGDKILKNSFFAWKLLFMLCLPLLFLASSCGGNSRATLKMEEQFSLKIGKLEDNLDIITLDGLFNKKIRLYMKDGLFYISNGLSCKLMVFNSYGDILSTFYNGDKNARPVLLSTTQEQGKIKNRVAHEFPFKEIGEVAKDSSGRLFIEDKVTENRIEYDEKLDTVLDTYILLFSPQGDFMNYLGQEGIGGSPFPYVQRVQINSQDEIIVVSYTKKAWLIYWFNKAGALITTVEIPLESLPLPEKDLEPALETIFADPDKRQISMKIDYYKIIKDEKKGEQRDTEFLESRIYWFNIESESYEGYITLPKKYATDNSSKLLENEEYEVLYEFLGVSRGGYMFFLSPHEHNYSQLLIMDRNGAMKGNKIIRVAEDDVVYTTFYVDTNGILSALLCTDLSADVVWWRGDKVIQRSSR